MHSPDINTSNVDKRISRFIQKHHVLTLATSRDNIPWCAHCFYAYVDDLNMLVFTSDPDTRHIREALLQKRVGVAIALETMVIGKIRGIQLTGTLEKPEGEKLRVAESAYRKRFPFAIFLKTTLWCIHPDYIKMTDNRLGFGTKLIWHSNPEKQ